MNMMVIERGTGPAVVLIPGIQGRWEWLERAIDGLATSFRVISFSLRDEEAGDRGRRPRPTLDDYVEQVRDVIDDCGAGRPVVCGISFGGLVALRFAARFPERTGCLVLVSTPGPSWRLRPTHAAYVRWPRASAPLFFLTAPWRLSSEIRMGIPHLAGRLRFGLEQLLLLVRAPLSARRMASRAMIIAAADVVHDCRMVTSPTLIVCGEASLDHVVTVGGTHEYAALIPGASICTLERTGHLGSLTRPDAFASALREFVRGVSPGALRPDAA